MIDWSVSSSKISLWQWLGGSFATTGFVQLGFSFFTAFLVQSNLFFLLDLKMCFRRCNLTAAITSLEVLILWEKHFNLIGGVERQLYG